MLFKHAVSTNVQKTLNYLLAHPGKPFHERDIARKAGISYGSANGILNRLYKDGILQKKGAGRMCYYTVDTSNAHLKELKILYNMLALEALVEKIKPHINKLVLFGSWATGADTEESDIDLFIVSSKEEFVNSILDTYSRKIEKKIQAVIKTPVDLINLSKRDKVLMKQVEQGKILWEKEPDDDND